MIMGGVTFGMRPLTMITSVIIARLLNPEDFGAVALVMVFLGSTQLFAGLRMSRAYIQSDLDSNSVAFHAFVVTAFSGTALFLFTFINAEWLCTVLGDPEVAPIMRALSFTILISTLTMIPNGILQKQLRFDAVAKSTVTGIIAYQVVTIPLAFFGFGVWSLVAGNLAQGLLSTIAILWFVPGWDWLKPRRWDWSIFQSLMRFGLPATGAGFVSYFSSKWDDWLVGRQLGVTSLGYYSKAYDFTNRTIRKFGLNVVGSVFFPAYAKIRDETERLRRMYAKSVQLVSSIMFPVAAGFFATAPILIPVVLGEKWLPMVTTFQVFSILLLTRPVSVNTSSVFSATGEPVSNLKAGLVLTAVMVPMTLLLIRYGIAGVAVAVLIGDIAGLTYNLYRVNKILPGARRDTFKATLPPFAAAFIMMLIVLAARIYLSAELGVNVWTLIILIALGVIIYLAGILILQREFSKEVLQTGLGIIDRKGRLSRFHSRGKPV